MNDFKPFDDKLSALIASLSPAGRRRMASDIAKKLRQRQQRRIKSQKAPDGTPYAARKKQPIRAKNGRIKREMFAKLRTSRFLKAKGSDSEAAIEFAGKVQRMVKVHHYGLKDKPGPKSQAVEYPARQLLGFSDDDRRIVEDVIISYLSD
ncbi:phage virion morphogenesis protein [Cronobacter sakazakii]|nr:phage virion morphogenesis protein [Cronobacter sakazakii]EGT4327023.1 phage virion morphogenesis protein [Cronobacter sakazakii]EGT4364601.1 phage virion morphogenesis protein [Cronobacter sakazakii]